MRDRTYRDFDLLVSATDVAGRYGARVLRSPAAEAGPISFKLPFTESDVDRFFNNIGRTRVRGRRQDLRALAEDFGGRLFDSVFRDGIRDTFKASVEMTTAEDVGLRIRLRLEEAPALADLPWEFVFDRTVDRFIALSDWSPLVRYMSIPESIRPLAVSPPLRVLVMAASPNEFDLLDSEEETARLRTALGDLIAAGRVIVDEEPTGTLAELQRALRRSEYHIFHFIGHGEFNEDEGDGVLFFEGERGRSRPVTGRALGELLFDHRSLRLVVLNACEGSRSGRENPFAGTAQSLLRQRIPAVVAMQFEITDRAAITFSHSFYEAVADGFPLDASVAEARKSVKNMPNAIEWATPVLHMRAVDGRVFAIEPASVGGKRDSGAALATADVALQKTGGGSAVTSGDRRTDPATSPKGERGAKRAAAVRTTSSGGGSTGGSRAAKPAAARPSGDVASKSESAPPRRRAATSAAVAAGPAKPTVKPSARSTGKVADPPQNSPAPPSSRGGTTSGADRTRGTAVKASTPPVDPAKPETTPEPVPDYRALFRSWVTPAPEPHARTYPWDVQSPDSPAVGTFESQQVNGRNPNAVGLWSESTDLSLDNRVVREALAGITRTGSKDPGTAQLGTSPVSLDKTEDLGAASAAHEPPLTAARGQFSMPGPVTSVSLSPDESWCFVTLKNEAVVYDFGSRAMMRRHPLPAPKGSRFLRWAGFSGTRGAISADGALVAASDGTPTVRVWNSLEGTEEGVVEHEGPVSNVAFDPATGRLVTSSSSKGVVFWAAPNEVAPFAITAYSPGCLAFAADGVLVAACTPAGATVWHSRTGTVQTHVSYAGTSRAVAFGPGARRLAVAGSMGVTIADPRSGGDAQTFLREDALHSVAYSGDGSVLAVGGTDIAYILDATTGAIKKRLTHSGNVTGVVFNSASKALLTGSSDRWLRTFDVA